MALISVTLPKLNGFEVARIVRDRPDLMGVPVLLLAGALDTLDDAQVRESGAAGVLIKNRFEPGLVIKRVRELLGMSKPDVGLSPERPVSRSGRLVTSGEAPVRAKEGPAADPAPLVSARREDAHADDARPERERAEEPLAEGRSDEAASWDEPRESSGRGPDAVAVETVGGGADYFGKLDAAFDSLDAQLAGRPAPAGRAMDAPPASRSPAAMDPERRPVPPPLVVPDPVDQLAARQGASPVFEVDEEWFGKNPASSFPHEEPTAALSESMTNKIPVPPPPTAGATYGDTVPTPPGLAADAFALLSAHEQGEALPAAPPPPPIELSEQAVDAVAQRLTDRLASSVVDDLAALVTGDLATRISDGLATRLTEELAPRVTEDLARRVSQVLALQLGEPLAERVSSGLAEQVAARVAEQVMQNAFGDSLRQTVHDVSERLVREEIARIRAASGGS